MLPRKKQGVATVTLGDSWEGMTPGRQENAVYVSTPEGKNSEQWGDVDGSDSGL